MSKTMYMCSVLLVAVTPWGHDEAEEFSEFEVFIEVNATDGDAGFQGFVDGDPWAWAKIKDPCGHLIFKLRPKTRLEEQGVTEFAWESAEPTFEEGPLDEFLERFPAGEYRAHAKTLEGGRLASTAELTHHLPDGPEITSPEEDGVVNPDEDLDVTWNAVTTQFSLAGLGAGPPLDGPIVKYTVTCETDDDGEDKVMTFDVLEGTAGTIPADFLDPDRDWKVEIGAFEESGNSTFRELPFCTHDEEECPEEEEE